MDIAIQTRLEAALAARQELMDAERQAAIRLFNGFYEGLPGLVVELFARTLVVFNHVDPPAALQPPAGQIVEFYRRALPWLDCVVLKARRSSDLQLRRGLVLSGNQPDGKIRESGIWYALDLLMNQDAGFYLDTRLLRRWALNHCAGARVLNTFAYTGSLGVAAQAAGAAQVIHLDRSPRFLALAKASYALNGFPVQSDHFWASDFFPAAARLRRQDRQFDCVFLDPPFFSTTSAGRVDMLSQTQRLVNKVRPLVAPGGYLAVINNALFLSGKDYLSALEALCVDGYLNVHELVPVPLDTAGFPGLICRTPPADPAPFNHPTKIAILRSHV